MIIPNLTISRAPRTPLMCARALESAICDPVAGPLRSLLKLERSAIATGTFVTVQLPIGDAFYFARPKAFPAAAKQTADIRTAFFDSETKCIHAVDVDDGVRRPCVDHQGTAPIVDRDRNKQMVADPAL